MVTNTVSSTTNMIQSASISPTPSAGVHSAAESTSTTRRVSDNRRSNKPIMEKRRRARINNCLNELKTLILDAMKKDPARHSKLEKADILEMTVKHLRNIQRQQAAISANTDPNLINMFRAGFFECANEIGRITGINPVIKRRLLQHLAHYIDKNLKQDVPQLQVHILPTDKNSENQLPQSSGFILSNTNGTDVQLLSRLSNANIAIVLPPAVQQQYASNSNSPVPLLVPIVPPEQERSTSAASVSSSSISCSPSHSPDVMDDMYYQPKPLSLVVRKNVEPVEEKPWRPW